MRGFVFSVLVIHGTQDEVIPFAHGEALYAEVQEPKQFLWVEGATHNDAISVAGDRYAISLSAFIALLNAK